MNKKIYKYFALEIITFMALFFSCSNQTIFYQIEQETDLENADIDGNCLAIIEFDNRIYCCNGNIYSKETGQTGGWVSVTKPEGYITKIAASNDVIYALNEKDKIFMSYDAAEWTAVDTSSLYSITTIFCDGDGNSYLNGKATKDSGVSYYALNGSTINSTDAVKSWCIVKNNGVTYTANGSTVTDSLGGTVADLGTIYSITYSSEDSRIYVGTNNGLVGLPFDNSGKLTGEKKDPPGNFSSTIRNFQVLAVLTTKDAIYCGIAETTSTYPHVKGLWSYYFADRPSWNKE